jgi:hypothetical protein
MEQRENPMKTIAISNCVKQVENAKVRGYGPEAGRLLGTPVTFKGMQENHLAPQFEAKFLLQPHSCLT